VHPPPPPPPPFPYTTLFRSVLLPGETVTARPRVLLLVPARTYRAADFILAAERMGLDLVVASDGALPIGGAVIPARSADLDASRSEEHTSELQSQSNIVCRL